MWLHVGVFNTCGEHCSVECSVTCFCPNRTPIELFTSTELLHFILFNYRVFYTINKHGAFTPSSTSGYLVFSPFFYKHLATNTLGHNSQSTGACFLHGKILREGVVESEATPILNAKDMPHCSANIHIPLLHFLYNYLDVPLLVYPFTCRRAYELFPVFVFFFFSYLLLFCSFFQDTDFCKGLGSSIKEVENVVLGTGWQKSALPGA